MKNKVIYLDSQASTPVDQDVLTAMLPYFTELYGNGNHKMGWKANAAVENARFQVAHLIGAKPSEIVFTSGSTEAINMALLGAAKANVSNRNHIITQKTEHKAVLETIKVLEQQGYTITMLDVDEVGRIRLEELKKAISNNTFLVAIMLANNEIGTVQPIEEIGAICKEYGTKFFSDITQGLGWRPLHMKKANIDFASISAHKIYGPKGIGALYINKSVTIDPIQYGGGHERGMRAGTLNVPGIVGLGKACEMLYENWTAIFDHIKKLRDDLKEQLFSSIDGIQLNGCLENRHPANLSVMIPAISGEELIGVLPNFMFSTKSACSSTSTKPSHVLSAITNNKETIENSFRIGMSKDTTKEEIDYVAKRIIEVVTKKQSYHENTRIT